MNTKRFVVVLAMLAGILATANYSDAQIVRPGIDRPIRVGMFKGYGVSSRYWHTNIHTANTVMRDILARPDTAGLGDSLVIPPAGFTFYSMPIALNFDGTAECAQNGCGPTQSQSAEFVSAMDTLDVIIMNSVTDWGSRVTDMTHRNAFQAFWMSKGYVATHGMTDSYGTWAPLDSIHGARLRGWPAEQNFTVRRDSAFMMEPAWKYLNTGVFSNSLDTSFFEEPIYFTQLGATIRARSHLKPTVNLVEASIVNPGSQTPMGDHPYSWYRQQPEGGRFFYTALGHRAQVWRTNRMFRRQVYNAILWTAGYNNDDIVTTVEHGMRGVAAAASRFADHAHVSFSGGSLTVSLLRDGAHSVEILALDGRRVDVRRGSGRADYVLDGLRQGTVYIVAVTAGGQRLTRFVTTP